MSNVQEIISGLNEIQVSFALAGEKAGPDSHHMRLSRLCGAAIEALQNQVEVSPAPVLDDVRIWVASELQAFGVAPHIRGKRYLIEAIVMVIEQPNMLIDGWEIIKCPDCGDECYLTQAARETMERHPKITAACTKCAMKKAMDGMTIS